MVFIDQAPFFLSLLEVTVFVEEKKKGQFTIDNEKRKKKQLKKAIIKSIYLQILATKKRKLWSKLVTMQFQDGKNNYSIFRLQTASKTVHFLERKFFGFRKKP